MDRMVNNSSASPFSPSAFRVDGRELEGKRALVTGGSRGIGAAIVRRLTDAGARVVASARTPVADKIREDIASGAGLEPHALTAGIPLGRQGVPTDVSELVGFLVSERAAWITGSTFMIDGGEASFVV